MLGSETSGQAVRLAPALAEFRTLGALALPIIVTQLAQMGMGVADAIMAGRVSATDLAGVTLGGNLYWPLMLLMSGIVMAVTPSVSQLRGAGQIGAAGAIVRQALWIAVSGGIALAILLQNVEPVYRLLGVDERAIPVARDYLRAASLGLPAMLAYVSLRCLCEGMSWTRPAMFIGVSMLALKVPLNWLFIHGDPALGVPAMGGVGCGWATAIVMAYALVAMVVVVSVSRVRASGVFRHVLPARRSRDRSHSETGAADRARALRGDGLLRRGDATDRAPRRGNRGRTSSRLQYRRRLLHGAPVTGHGSDDPRRLQCRHGQCRGRETVGLGGGHHDGRLGGITFSTVLLVWRHELVALYTTEAEVIQVAAGLLLIGALFQVFDSTQATVMGALRGYKDTRAPMMIALVAYWVIGLPVGATLCFGLQGGRRHRHRRHLGGGWSPALRSSRAPCSRVWC